MDVEPQPPRQQRLRDQQAIGADDDGGRIEVEPGSGPFGLQHRDPESLGDDLGRRRGNLAAASLRRIGPGQEDGDLVLRGEPLQHIRPERRRRGDGDPRCHALPRQDEPGAQLGHRLAPRLRIRAIDDHLAVEVVELVLDDAGGHALELEVNGGPRGVEPVERHLDSALDRHPDRPEREAALLVDLGLACPEP